MDNQINGKLVSDILYTELSNYLSNQTKEVKALHFLVGSK